uniref:Methyltransferase FkbM domain-containing protein n=1 Tax=Panagrolaimus sp. ES5 TaxID=591445 RepID=A0AC34GCZ4_9BILA
MKDAAKLYYNKTAEFFQEFSKCIKIHISIDETKMDNFENTLFEEKKMFIPLQNKDERECKWLTIGVGEVTGAERKFKEMYPNCAVFGVEPDKNRQGNFSKIGKIMSFGVGLENTISDVVVLEKDWVHRKSKVVSLPNLLDEYLHTRFVHYLTIDIEGFEYRILEALVSSNGKFVNEGITFCQIDAELHNIQMSTVHSAVKDLNPVQFILDFLHDSSPYIPIFNVPYIAHQKVTFINIKDQDCENAFKFSKYLQ